MTILSVQSQVVYGHVGNRASVFPLERMGFEVWPMNTVQFSNHTGYPQWKGMVFPGSHIAELWEGLSVLGCVSSCDAVLSGYMGSLDIGEAILDIVASLRKNNPHSLYCCDPVMGDYEGGLYVKPDIPLFFKDRVLPQASIIKPNQFEAELLSGVAIRGMDDARKACVILHAAGPAIILVTSLEVAPGPGDMISTLLSFGGQAYLARTPRFAFSTAPHGAGDLASALFLGNYLETADPLLSFERMASAVHKVFEATCAAQATGRVSELAIVGAQDAFVARERLFRAERIW